MPMYNLADYALYTLTVDAPEFDLKKNDIVIGQTHAYAPDRIGVAVRIKDGYIPGILCMLRVFHVRPLTPDEVTQALWDATFKISSNT